MALPKRRDVDVVVAVVVIVTDSRAHAEERNPESRLRGHITEGPVAVVVVELQRRGLARRGPIFAVDQQNVGVAVVVVVDESAAGAHGLGQPLLAGGTIVVDEVDARLPGDVLEGDLRPR